MASFREKWFFSRFRLSLTPRRLELRFVRPGVHSTRPFPRYVSNTASLNNVKGDDLSRAIRAKAQETDRMTAAARQYGQVFIPRPNASSTTLHDLASIHPLHGQPLSGDGQGDRISVTGQPAWDIDSYFGGPETRPTFDSSSSPFAAPTLPLHGPYLPNRYSSTGRFDTFQYGCERVSPLTRPHTYSRGTRSVTGDAFVSAAIPSFSGLPCTGCAENTVRPLHGMIHSPSHPDAATFLDAIARDLEVLGLPLYGGHQHHMRHDCV